MPSHNPWMQKYKHWYQSAAQLVVPLTTEENTGQHGSAVPGWQVSLVCTQNSYQWAISSSHSACSVFTGLFWSGGRSTPGPQLIGWEGRVPVKSGQSWGVCVGGGIIDQESLVLFWQWPMEEAGPKTHMRTHIVSLHTQTHHQGPLIHFHQALPPW